jgi:hypothetical protein
LVVNQFAPQRIERVTAFDLVAEGIELEQRQREMAADPVVWINNVLDEEPWSKQREIAYSVRDVRRTAVKSCHDVGKSYIASRIVCWWIAAHPPGEAFVVTSAPTFQQVRAILWREIGKAHSKGRLIGTMNETEWKIGKELVGFGRKPSDYSPTAFQGIHARYVLVVLDEACGVPESLWDAADTLIPNESSRILAIGNPDDPTTEFSKICKPGTDWNKISISAFDSPNFTGEYVRPEVSELLISPTWVEEKRKKWGENHPFWQSKVLGEFPQQSATALLPLDQLFAAARREIMPTEDDIAHTTIGVDVARFGNDRTVISMRQGGKARIIHKAVGNDTMETAAIVRKYIHAYQAELAAIDTIGVGAGVFDRLSEQEEPVFAMIASARAKDFITFSNARAEWYWNLREILERGELDIDEEDEELLSELASLQFKVDTRGRILIESKEDMKKRGLPSPDLADGLVLSFGAPVFLDWDAAYGLITCPKCEKKFLEEGRTTCPGCGQRLD